ncbi:Protein of unknown function [Gryllus bimaculatus]|nr:Protein of unknown function [Gryllus bimaculatus]
MRQTRRNVNNSLRRVLEDEHKHIAKKPRGSVKGEEVDRHPEKRFETLYTAFGKKANMRGFKAENPNL